MNTYGIWITQFTEKWLTKRKQKQAQEKRMKSEKKTLKKELLSWVDAIVFAVIFVLIINQFLFQLFMIPTPSMVDTLLIKDRVYVSKTSYGIELYPTGPKLFSSITPLRDDVIVFYNPMYSSRGPLFDILSQIIYMGTFSLVNIDKDEMGNPRERLYVKRSAAMSGDVVRFENGLATVRGFGQIEEMSDDEFRKINNLSRAPHQSIDPSLYPGFEAYGSLLGYQDLNVSNLAPSDVIATYQALGNYNGLVDFYEVNKMKTRTLSEIDPSNLTYRSDKSRYDVGIYVPEGYTLPLGDNRDNSQDGRYFGPVKNSSIIGKVKFIFWPFSSIKSVK